MINNVFSFYIRFNKMNFLVTSLKKKGYVGRLSKLTKKPTLYQKN